MEVLRFENASYFKDAKRGEIVERFTCKTKRGIEAFLGLTILQIGLTDEAKKANPRDLGLFCTPDFWELRREDLISEISTLFEPFVLRKRTVSERMRSFGDRPVVFIKKEWLEFDVNTEIKKTYKPLY